MKKNLLQFDITFLGYLGILTFFHKFYPPLDHFGWFFFLFFIPFAKALRDALRKKAPKAFVAKVGMKMVICFLNPFIFVQGIWQAVGEIISLFRLFVLKENVFSKIQNLSFQFPFSGDWKAVSGGTTKDTSHSWEILNQRYAYDFVLFDENEKYFSGAGKQLKEFYAFGQAVLAPADGTVIRTKNSARDYSKPHDIDFFSTNMGGNYIMIEHASGVVSLIAHLQRNSVVVKKGDHVRKGQVIGRCGNSGHSTAPHIHFHIQDSRLPFFGLGLPIPFEGGGFK